jgi:hypothetical protein
MSERAFFRSGGALNVPVRIYHTIFGKLSIAFLLVMKKQYRESSAFNEIGFLMENGRLVGSAQCSFGSCQDAPLRL